MSALPPLSPVAATLRAASFHRKIGFRGKRGWLGPLLLLVPVLFSALAWYEGQKINAFEQSIAPYTLFGGLALLLPLLYAGGAWADEVERRTITYLLLRPVPRASLYVGKVLGASLTIIAWLWAAELLCFGIISSAYPLDIFLTRLWDLLHHAEALFFSGLAYGAIYAFLGVLLPRFSLIVGIGYSVLVEVVLPLLPTSFRRVTVQYYLHAIAGLDPSTERVYAILILLGYAVVFLAAGALLARRRDYVFGD